MSGSAGGRPKGLTLTNWDLGGEPSAWAYAHTAELFPSIALSAGCVPAELGTDDVPLPPFVAAEVATGRVSALTVLRGGRVVQRWGAVGEPRLLMSVSKVFASLAIGLLAADGRVDVAGPVRDALPELGPQWEGCTLREVADMASGVACPEAGDPGSYQDPAHPFFQFEASLGWRPRTRPETPYELALSYDRRGIPGSTYDYTSVNTFLLAWIVERATARRYPAALQELIWNGLALREPSRITVNDEDAANAHGGILMSTDDLARFGAVFTPSSGRVGHALAVPPSYLAMLQETRSYVAAGIPAGTRPAGQWNWVAPDGDLFKSGFGGQGLFVSPGRDIVIAFAGAPDALERMNRLPALVRPWADALTA